MANGNGNVWIMRIATALIITFIVGGIAAVVAIAQMDTRLDHVEETDKEMRPKMEAVAVMQNDITHIKNSQKEIKDDVAAILAELRRE